MAYEVTKAPVPLPTESGSHALNIMGYIHAIRRRKSLMLLGLAIGFGLGIFYYSRVPPVYETGAKILITLKNPDVLGAGDRGYGMEDQVANQISMIRSPLIARDAAKWQKLKPKDKPPSDPAKEIGAKVDEKLAKDASKVTGTKVEDKRAEEEAKLAAKNEAAKIPNENLAPFFGNLDSDTLAGAILGGLNATRGDLRSGEAPSVVSLTYRTGDPMAAMAVLEEVIDAHKRVVAKSYGDLDTQTVEFIKIANEKLSKQLDDTFKLYSEAKLKSITNSDRSLIGGGDKPSLLEKSSFQNKQEALLTRNGEIRTHLNAIHKGWINYKSTKSLLTMAERFMSTSGPVNAPAPMSEALLGLMAQEQDLSSLFGNDYLPLQRLRAKLAMYKKHFGKNVEQAGDDAETPLARHIRELKEEQDCNSTLCDAYGELLREQTNKLKEAYSTELQIEKLNGDYIRTKQMFDATLKKLGEIDLTKNMAGINTVLLSPPTPGRKVAPILSTCLSISSFFGVLIGFGLVYLAEVTDRSFKGPEDVVHRLGAPVIAHMPAIDYNKLVTAADVDSGTTLSPVLCVYHRPKSRDAEAIRGIRTAIFFGNQSNNLRLIQFTSAQAGDGKSTLACNVALSIAQSGKRVIIVEADLRRPSFSAVFGKMPEVGFAQVLAGADRWQDAILTFPEVPNLAVLPCGERPHNPAELLTGPLLVETLDQMKEVYDYVIIDTPPLLPVTDPCSVAAHADGVILVVQMGRNTRPNAERAVSLMETLGVRLIGIVMNRMTKDGGYGYGYGYGSYGYNYGGGYKYGGGYGYRSESGYYARGEAYYEEEHRNGADNSTPAK